MGLEKGPDVPKLLPGGGPIGLAAGRSSGEVAERLPAVMLLGKRCEQSSLEVTCSFVLGDRVPGDEQLVGVGELPGQPATAVSYRLADAEPAELAQPATEDVGLAYVHDVRRIDAFASEACFGDGRVPALEPAGRARVYRRRNVAVGRKTTYAPARGDGRILLPTPHPSPTACRIKCCLRGTGSRRILADSPSCRTSRCAPPATRAGRCSPTARAPTSPVHVRRLGHRRPQILVVPESTTAQRGSRPSPPDIFGVIAAPSGFARGPGAAPLCDGCGRALGTP